MPSLMKVYVNTTRNACRLGDNAWRRSEARRTVKLFLVPRDASMSDTMVPDYLVTESMIDRFLEIDPPPLRSTIEFDPIIEEIERTYVLGAFFSALSASVVTAERMLNTARIEIHKFITPKIKNLWDKGPTNDWEPNIEALVGWKYLTEDLAREMRALYTIRCHYLHSGDVTSVATDSLQALRATYRLLGELIGFPSHLFRLGSVVECLAPNDPLVRVFYTPIKQA